MKIKNPYEVLGVSPNTPSSELKKVYRNLCLKNHPDNGGNQKKFAEITEAYNLITSGKYQPPIKRNTVVHGDGLFKYTTA